MTRNIVIVPLLDTKGAIISVFSDPMDNTWYMQSDSYTGF